MINFFYETLNVFKASLAVHMIEDFVYEGMHCLSPMPTKIYLEVIHRKWEIIVYGIIKLQGFITCFRSIFMEDHIPE